MEPDKVAAAGCWVRTPDACCGTCEHFEERGDAGMCRAKDGKEGTTVAAIGVCWAWEGREEPAAASAPPAPPAAPPQLSRYGVRVDLDVEALAEEVDALLGMLPADYSTMERVPRARTELSRLFALLARGHVVVDVALEDLLG